MPFIGSKLLPLLLILSVLLPPAQTSQTGPTIGNLSNNLNAYPGAKVPRYARFELTFEVQTTAPNPFLPYDPAPPPGLMPAQGITIDAAFSPDNWRTTYTVPAFYYQDFEVQIKDQSEWFYPRPNHLWKVRFAPPQSGTWQVRLLARDTQGQTDLPAGSFEVIPSSNPGFIRVSQRDPRYFEFENGAYFPALGFNLNYDQLDWDNPVLENQANLENFEQNGIQLIRIWLSQWSIFGSAWNPWRSPDPDLNGRYIPFSGLTMQEAVPGSEVSLQLAADGNPCMLFGGWKPAPAVKPHTNYRIRLIAKTSSLSGPQTAGQPYGLAAKIGDARHCAAAADLPALTPYLTSSQGAWQTLEGAYRTGSESFLPKFFLSLDNVTSGTAWIDSVYLEEDLGNGAYGPNLIYKPDMDQHLYFDQRSAFAFDRLLEQAEQHNVYLRPVVLEKKEWILTHLNHLGQPIPDDPACRRAADEAAPPECPASHWFYGDPAAPTKTRWLQQAWWRYLQARWGYSTSIHSWELLNEGDPASQAHFALAQDFGEYMHAFRPNQHLVSTSFWHSFPAKAFWSSPRYPDIDFADIHAYIHEGEGPFDDPAIATAQLSLQLGPGSPDHPAKPIIRGETGFIPNESGPAFRTFAADPSGDWLHDFLWAGLNSGGLIESYWYTTAHIFPTNRQGNPTPDLRPQFGAYYNFVRNIPLNNGYYQDALPQISNPELRAWGQKDLTHQRLHLWIQNRSHTWENLAASAPISSQSGAITVSGFTPHRLYLLQWWSTHPSEHTSQILETTSLKATASGELVVPIHNLVSDIALKVFPAPAAARLLTP